MRDGEIKPPPTPKIPDRPGKEALRDWVRACYEDGLKHNPVFSKGGEIVIRWAADRDGNLLWMDFVKDTFRGWAIKDTGETLADCVVNHAQGGEVRWSQQGIAPIRLEATLEATSEP